MQLPGLQQNVVLAPFTTYKIGGPADYFIEAGSIEELIRAVAAARAQGTEFFILGAGANILVSDAGYRGLVIHNRARNIEIDSVNGLITAESGATLGEVIAAAKAAELGELEYFTYVPSSIGGAVRQNFHFIKVDAAHFAATGEIISSETQYLADRVAGGVILDTEGKVHRVDHDWFKFDYDYSVMLETGDILLSADLRVVLRPADEIQAQIDASLAWRKAKQPLLEDFPSSGSIFMKIAGVGAGRLIEAAGLKGFTVGGAQVSPKHANYIVNLGGATAQDVLQVIRHVQTNVQATSGYELKTEIGLVGEWPAS
jgi:UDP-N-acetylmuramate dehydrogenase